MQDFASCNVQDVCQFIFIYSVDHTIAITNLSFKNCLVAFSPLLRYYNKSVFTSDADLPDDKHISFSLACSCMSKGFWQFKNPICSCWTSFSLFLSSCGLQSDFLKSTTCYIPVLTDGSYVDTQIVKSSQKNYQTLKHHRKSTSNVVTWYKAPSSSDLSQWCVSVVSASEHATLTTTVVSLNRLGLSL